MDWKHGVGPSRTGTYRGTDAAVINIGAPGSPVQGPQFGGNCSVGGTWYQGKNFPASYKNAYFHADLGNQWIKNVTFDANNNPVSVRDFATAVGGIVCLAENPLNGTLYYIDFYSGIHKISYGGNQPPIAVASSDVNYGPTPLTVHFTGSGSFDPEGLPLLYNWDFGDGTPPSVQADPTHVFNAVPGVPTLYVVRLTVTDPGGLSSQASLNISLNNTPPSVTITSPASGTKYPMTGDSVYNLRADVTDAEQSDSQLSYQWQTILHHNNHEHPNPIDTNHVTSTVISPIGCDGNLYYYRIVLTVTDSAGLSSQAEVDLYPDCSNTPPQISDIPNQTIDSNRSTGPIPFLIGDAETPAANLTLTGSSSNPALVSNNNILFGGSGSNRTVTITPASNQSGTATITVTVSDGSLNASDSLLLTVNSTNAPPPTNAPAYLLTEGFEGPGYENSDWIEHGAPNPDYTAIVLHGSQSLNCAGEQYLERPFAFTSSFYLYFKVRWNVWGDYNSIIYWDDPDWNIVAGLYADDNRLEVDHGSAYAVGTTTIVANTTYHLWVEWTKGTGNNGTMKLFISTTGVKPATPEANITAGNGGATQRIYIGPTSSGPNVIFDRILVDDVPIGSNP